MGINKPRIMMSVIGSLVIGLSAILVGTLMSGEALAPTNITAVDTPTPTPTETATPASLE